ncbi:hypothetical protein [Luteimonas saliphila]|uniref:hypothetical protein n=1 Tax=Luteimonas saliphila TaxID=2804919 RepID=UPI00192DAB12|nr:hypothetical protein [Luteimonas saliphila]
MKIKYFGYMEGKGMGNLAWEGAFPMNGGKFPAAHPVGGGVHFKSGQYGNSEAMDAFRQRGYWASCFPEGDGITFKPVNGQTTEQAQQDVRECFGWDVKVMRP